MKKDPRTKRINYNNFFINLLESPTYYHVHILPDDFKEEIIVKLENFVKEYNEKYDTDISKIFEYILHELTKPFDEKAARHFLRVTQKLDDIRNENTFETIPEMTRIKEALNV